MVWRLHLVLALVWVFIAPSTQAAFSEELIREGVLLLQKKQYREALEVFDRAKSTPGDARPYFYSGLALSESGQLGRAAAELRQAIEMNPEQAEYSLVYAEVLARLGRKLAASEALARLGEEGNLDQLSSSELWLLTGLYVKLDQLDKALGVLNAYQQVQPNDPRLPLQRGEILLKNGDYSAAQQAYREVLESGHAPAAGHYGLGLSLWRQGEIEAAKDELLEAQRLQPLNVEYRYQLGQVLLDLGEAEAALAELEKIEHLGKDFPPLYSALAKAARRAGQPQRSSVYFEKFRESQARLHALETSQQRADVLVTQAAEKLNAGNVAEAERLLLEAARTNPDAWVAHKYLARIYLDSGRPASAYSHLSTLGRLQPESYDFNALIAEYWYRQQQPSRAREHAEKAKQLSPGDADLRNLLGNIYLRLGLRSEALEEYKAAVALSPERSEFRLNYETLRRSLGDRPS